VCTRGHGLLVALLVACSATEARAVPHEHGPRLARGVRVLENLDNLTRPWNLGRGPPGAQMTTTAQPSPAHAKDTRRSKRSPQWPRTGNVNYRMINT
jgi:hypothetical protein